MLQRWHLDAPWCLDLFEKKKKNSKKEKKKNSKKEKKRTFTSNVYWEHTKNNLTKKTAFFGMKQIKFQVVAFSLFFFLIYT